MGGGDTIPSGRKGLSALEKAKDIRRNSNMNNLPGLGTEASMGSLDNAYG